MAYSIVHVDDIEGTGPGGTETEQEEVNVIVAGSGVYRIEGKDVPSAWAASCASNGRRGSRLPALME